MLSRDMSVLPVVGLREDDEDEWDEGYDPEEDDEDLEEDLDDDLDEDDEDDYEEYVEELDVEDEPRRARHPLWD